MKTTLTLLTASILLILCALSTSCTKTFEDIWQYSEGTFPIQENGKWGYVDIRGKYIIKPQYDLVNGFQYGVASVTKDGKTGVIRKDGTYLAEPQFDEIGTVAHNRPGCFVQKDGKWGLLDKVTGKYLVKPKFSEVRSVACDYCFGNYPEYINVKENGRWRFIDIYGNDMSWL